MNTNIVKLVLCRAQGGANASSACRALTDGDRREPNSPKLRPKSERGCLTRNDERCSDPTPRPRSFFSGRMPSFPPCFFFVVSEAMVATFLLFGVAYNRGLAVPSIAASFTDGKVVLPR